MKTRSSSPLSPSLSPNLSPRRAPRRAPAPRVAPAGPRRLGLLPLLPLLLGLACGGGAKDEDTSPTGGADGSADGADGGDGGGGLDGAAPRRPLTRRPPTASLDRRR